MRLRSRVRPFARPQRRSNLLRAFTMVTSAVVTERQAFAWAEHEHEAIGRRAADELRHDRQAWASLQELWEAARLDKRRDVAMCNEFDDETARCVALPALPMLAGDHSCAPYDLERALGEEWPLDVIRVARATQQKVEQLHWRETDAQSRAYGRLEIRRELDIELQSVDAEYVTRAEGNSSHFALEREANDESLARYVERAMGAVQRDAPGGFKPDLRRPKRTRINATALYVHYHSHALHAAAKARGGADEARSDLAYQALLNEAFALHFLQDSFSAGHLVGAPEDNAVRMGTHDYYCREGIATELWGRDDSELKNGQAGRVDTTYAAHGDAFLFDADLDHAAWATRASLAQLAAAFDPRLKRSDGNADAMPPRSPFDHAPYFLSDAERRAFGANPPTLPPVNSCVERFASQLLAPPGPDASGDEDARNAALRVMTLFPKPAVILEGTPSTGDLPTGPPQKRNEFGLFIPALLRVYGTFGAIPVVDEGLGNYAFSAQARGGLGIGVATDGILSDYQDGLMYATFIGALGVHGTNQREGASWSDLGILGLGGRIRLPYAYVPGDVIVWGPMALAGSSSGVEALRRALKGGLTPWGDSNVLYASGPVRLSFEAGREFELLVEWFRRDLCREAEATSQGKQVPTCDSSTLQPTQFDLSTPLLNVRVARSYEDHIAHELNVRLGARVGHQRGPSEVEGLDGTVRSAEGWFLGAFLSVDSMSRFYP